MRVRSVLGLAVGLLFVLSSAAPVPAADDFIGAVWEVRGKNMKTGNYDKIGFMRCTTDGRVFVDGKVVGTHKNTGLETIEVEVTDAANPVFNGTGKYNRVAKNGSIWEGVHKRKKDGVEVPVRLFLKKD